MINEGEDELICDLAQTYHVLNYKELPPSLAAILAVGLDEDSRIKRKLSGQILTISESLQAVCADILNLILWTKTKDAAKNRNRPQSLLRKLNGLDKEEKDDLMTFDTPEEFEEWLRSKQEQ